MKKIEETHYKSVLKEIADGLKQEKLLLIFVILFLALFLFFVMFHNVFE